MTSTALGLTALINIVLTLLGIGLSWWALHSLKLELFLNDPKGPRAITLRILLAIVIGHALARFISDYSGWSNMLSQLF